MKTLLLLGWTLLFSIDVLGNELNYREKALRAAENSLGDKKVAVVQDKWVYLQNLSITLTDIDTFHLVDIKQLVDRFDLWDRVLPRVIPHYAVKTNNDDIIISVLNALGTGFDCASQQEIQQAIQNGASPSNIVFSHPRKSHSSILYAKEQGVTLLVVDSIEELNKISSLYPTAQLIVRIITDDAGSATPLSHKFGATLDEAREILRAGFQMGVSMCGISFHVGSNCTNKESYRKAIEDAASLFKYFEDCFDMKLSLLDIGGGWPGTHDARFIAEAQLVSDLLDRYFDQTVTVIAEPGRYFASQTTTLATRILGKKKLADSQKISYFLSNGVFGFFISSLYYNYDLPSILSEGWIIRPLLPQNLNEPLLPSLLWGPTCDSGDKILDGLLLPEMNTGEFLTVENIGAYSKSLETSFNGIPLSMPYYIYSE